MTGGTSAVGNQWDPQVRQQQKAAQARQQHSDLLSVLLSWRQRPARGAKDRPGAGTDAGSSGTIFSAQSPALGKEPGARQDRSEQIDAGSAEQKDVRTPPHHVLCARQNPHSETLGRGVMAFDVGVHPGPGGGGG